MHSPAMPLPPVACLLALLVAGTSHAAAFPSGGMLDIRDWTTHCFGRHLVALPADAVVAHHTLLQNEAIVPIADSYAELMERIERSEAGGRRPRNDVATGARRINLGDRSIGLLSPPLSDAAGRRLLQAYLVSRPTWRVFDWRQPLGADGEAGALRDASILAGHLRSREPTEVPEGPGYCIDGGFITEELDTRTAETRVEFTLPGHPGMLFSFLSGLSPPASSSGPAGARPLRKERRHVGVLRGHEQLLAAGDKAARQYLFTWQSQEAGPVAASLTLRLPPSHGDGGLAADTPDSPAAATDRAILALWDAIVAGMRLRSDAPRSASTPGGGRRVGSLGSRATPPPARSGQEGQAAAETREAQVERALEALTRHLQDDPPGGRPPTRPPADPEFQAQQAARNARARAQAWAGCDAPSPYLRLKWEGLDLPVANNRYRLLDQAGKIVADGVTDACGTTAWPAAKSARVSAHFPPFAGE